MIKRLILFFLVLSAQSNIIHGENTFMASYNPEIQDQETTVTPGSVKIYQDKRITDLLSGKKGPGQKEQTTSGYRVQVFSSNQQRTAKTEAFKTEKMIKEQFPDEGVYVNYTSPFWKVRVGDFKTREEAAEFRNELTNTYPSLKSEIYIVKEQILISPNK